MTLAVGMRVRLSTALYSDGTPLALGTRGTIIGVAVWPFGWTVRLDNGQEHGIREAWLSAVGPLESLAEVAE